jgi:methylated-DNA-[protein]-cysteine S-methyltransferase
MVKKIGAKLYDIGTSLIYVKSALFWTPMNSKTYGYHLFESASGSCGIAWSDTGIRLFQLPSRSVEAAERNLLRRLPDASAGAPPPLVLDAIAAAARYFDGEKIDFSAIELDLGEQSVFARRCYGAARLIGWGQTTTYGTLAKELGGAPESAREVGQAMANNPIPLIIPCHRVLAAGGKLGGFSAPGGSEAKLRMLQLEGYRTNAAPPEQRSMEF